MLLPCLSPVSPANLHIGERCFGTNTHTSSHTTQPCLLQVPFSHLTQIPSHLYISPDRFIQPFKAFCLERLYPCKSFVTVLHHAEMFPLSPRQNPCCSLSAICLVHSRAIFYLSAMMTSKEVIPASPHPICPFSNIKQKSVKRQGLWEKFLMSLLPQKNEGRLSTRTDYGTW